MPPIRNSSVARGQVAANTQTIVYTVPANTVLLLKSIQLSLTAAAAVQIIVWLYAAGGSVSVVPIYENTAANGTLAWSGWIALNAGDTIQLFAATDACNYWISGALLPFVPGF